MKNKRKFYKNFKYTLIISLIIIICAIVTLLLYRYKSNSLYPVNIVNYTLSILFVISIATIYYLHKSKIRPILLIIRSHIGSSLQKRVMFFFSLGAAVPSIIVTIFSIYFFYFNLQAWFDKKISTVLDESIIVGRSYIQENTNRLKETALSVADLLSSRYYDLVDNQELFNVILNEEARMHSFDEAIVFQKSNNSIIAQTFLSFSLSFTNIPLELINKADKGEIVKVPSDPTKIRILIKLLDYDDSYLLIGRLIDQKVIDHIAETNGTANQYFELQKQIYELQLKFLIIFILVTILLLVFSIIWGNNFASKLVIPIHKLVTATESVKNSNFDIQVSEDNLPHDEIRSLTLAFNRMIRQLKMQQKDLIESQKKLVWSDVARKVAHEIKNPLTPIQLSAEMLRRKLKTKNKESADIIKYVDNILKHSEDIKNIVVNFVNFARLPLPKFELCDIVSVIRDSINSRKLVYSGIEYKFSSNVKTLDFPCDQLQINQVMINLLKNAEESLNLSSKNLPIINVNLMLKDAVFTIIVSDNGPGFDLKIIENIYKEHITTKIHGTGLGLSIVSKIINDHFGSIELYNDEQRGGAVVKLIFYMSKLISKLK